MRDTYKNENIKFAICCSPNKGYYIKFYVKVISISEGKELIYDSYS